MGQGLSIFLIADKHDVKVFGCRRRKLLREVLKVLADRLADYDDQADVEDDGLISHADALKEIFSGKLTREADCSSVYGWAYELYCSSMGDWLSNSQFCPCTAEWFKTLDDVLKRYGVPLRFHKLLFEDFPIPLNDIDGPCGGTWEHEEMVAAHVPLQQATTTVNDHDIREALEQIVGWVEEAIAAPGSVIVGFFG